MASGGASKEAQDYDMSVDPADGRVQYFHSGGISGAGIENRVNEVGMNSLDPILGQTSNQRQGYSDPKRSISRFFYKSGMEFSEVELDDFVKMIMHLDQTASRVLQHIPNVRELQGSILKDELKSIHQHVQEIRQSWLSTGCSIVLDGWTNSTGQNLINVLVDCPRGPLYLQSLNISAVMNGKDRLKFALDTIIREVGLKNIVQIISYTSLDILDPVKTWLKEEHKSLFWTVSATHCVTLILERISQINYVGQTVDSAKILTRFIYSNPSILSLSRRNLTGRDLIKPSKIRIVTDFLTLENVLFEKKNLKKLFAGFEWKNSLLASTTEGKRVARLISDKLFWNRVNVVVNATIPLVKFMSLINERDKSQMGILYETMDQLKETIRERLGRQKAAPFWDIIDDVWDNVLHSPLHAAGYYLNPALYYTEDFVVDDEVNRGLLSAILQWAAGRQILESIMEQIDAYRLGLGDFKTGAEINERNSVNPVEWWHRYGNHCKELQGVAIRILSQTCNCGFFYGLKRGLAEQLLSQETNNMEHQFLLDLTFLEYNLQLRQIQPGTELDIRSDEINPSDGWVGDGYLYDVALEEPMRIDGLSTSIDGGAV